MQLIHVFDWIDDLRQLCLITSWSTVIPKLFKRGPAVAISWTSCLWSAHQALYETLICMLRYCCLLGKTTSVSKKNKKKLEKENLLDSTLIRQMCAQNCLWSDRPRPKWPLSGQVPVHCLDKIALQVISRPRNSSAPRTCVVPGEARAKNCNIKKTKS